jgi:LPXTG-motif cell wall-anchored protein
VSWLGNPWVGIAGLAVFAVVGAAVVLTRRNKDGDR